MNKQTTKELESLIYDFARAEDLNIIENYSGRGMFDKECFGFVGREVELIVGKFVLFVLDEVGERFIQNNRDFIEDMVFRARFDNMGLNGIVYFPGLALSSEEEEGLE